MTRPSSSPSIGVVVQYAPWVEWREASARRIYNRVNRAGYPTSRVAASREESVWNTAKRCWRDGWRLGTDYVLVMQDDVALPTGFEAGLERFVANVHSAEGPAPMCLCCPRQNIGDEARSIEVNAVPVRRGVWGQARLLPAGEIKPLLRWSVDAIPEAYPHDDGVEALFTDEYLDQPVWHPMPSLVEHVGDDHTSLGNSAPRGDRRAAWYVEDVRDIGYEVPADPPAFSIPLASHPWEW